MSGRKRKPGTPYHSRISSPARPRKLTPEQVQEMRSRLEAGEKVATFAREYGVAEGTARRELGLLGKGLARRPRKLTLNQEEQARRRHREDHEHPRDLAEEYGVSHSTMKRYLGLATDSHS